MTVAGLAKSAVGNMKKRMITVTATATVNSAIKSIGGHTALQLTATQVKSASTTTTTTTTTATTRQSCVDG
jgi:hypothetical protein